MQTCQGAIAAGNDAAQALERLPRICADVLSVGYGSVLVGSNAGVPRLYAPVRRSAAYLFCAVCICIGEKLYREARLWHTGWLSCGCIRRIIGYLVAIWSSGGIVIAGLMHVEPERLRR